ARSSTRSCRTSASPSARAGSMAGRHLTFRRSVRRSSVYRASSTLRRSAACWSKAINDQHHRTHLARKEHVMIEENRRLTFSMDELATAVLSYLITSKKMGEKDKLGKIAVNEGGEVGVLVTVVPSTGEAPSNMEIGTQVLGALLIAHCIKRKVPL